MRRQVTMIHMRKVPREDFNKQLIRKMAPPLVTLLSSPEGGSKSCCETSIFCYKSVAISSRMRCAFFCRYNDSYFKVEKVGHHGSLSNENNVDALSRELKEYTIQLDRGFYRLD